MSNSLKSNDSNELVVVGSSAGGVSALPFWRKREVIGLPVREFFSGRDLDRLIDVLGEVVQHGKPATTPPMLVKAVEYGGLAEDRFIHSVVPIHGADGNKAERLFIYTEKEITPPLQA
jgi:hypothetical protein